MDHGVNDEKVDKKCSECSKTFSTKKNLTNHMLTLHQKVCAFKCHYPACDKAYCIESRLRVHLRTHDNKKPFKCEICNKSFSERGYLKTHKKFHSDQRPFSCIKCDKTYKTKGHLKDHYQVQHVGLKKYQCIICTKFFGRSSTLKSHMKTHTGEKTIKCRMDSCQQFFSEKGNMEMHYKRHFRPSCLIKEIIKGETGSLIDSKNVTRPCSKSTLVSNSSCSVDNHKIRFNVNKGGYNRSNDNREMIMMKGNNHLLMSFDVFDSRGNNEDNVMNCFSHCEKDEDDYEENNNRNSDKSNDDNDDGSHAFRIYLP